MSLLQDYGGSFEPEFSLERLERAALGRLGREYMLFAHLHDRGIMPLVGSRFGGKAITELALDEWMGASPIYNRRNRQQLAISGDGVSAILKTLQLDPGFPHQYMDVHYELVDESLGYFWLGLCGAFQDVLANSGGRAAPIIQICHHMEDPTFDATVMAVNPRARCRPEHRPPLQIGHTGATCRWRVFIGDEPGAVDEREITRRVARSRAARFRFPEPRGEPADGLSDYAGPFRADFVLEDLDQPTLARQCKEFALDTHLLMRAAFLSIAEHRGPDVAQQLACEHWWAVAPVSVQRVRAALRIEGDDMAAILKTLQVDPAFPHDYVKMGFELLDARRGRVWIEDCEAFAPGEPEAWLALLEDPEQPGFDAAVAAVNPRARCRPAAAGHPSGLAWEIEIDPAASPREESPMARAVRHSNASSFVFRSREG